MAAKDGELKEVKQLVEGGTDINMKDDKGVSLNSYTLRCVSGTVLLGQFPAFLKAVNNH